MNIQWFPGHMAKAKREIGESLKMADIVIEIADCRAPRASRSSDLGHLINRKPLIVALNKCDLADSSVTCDWIEHFIKAGTVAVPICSVTGDNFAELRRMLDSLAQEKRERDQARGMKGRAIKILVAGVPNVGKSAFINKFSGRSAMEIGNRPGVTKMPQWIRVGDGYDLLDTPGVLAPKFNDELTGLRLVWIGAIKDEIIDKTEAAMLLCEFLRDNYPESLREQYKLDGELGGGYEILLEIGKKRGCIVSGGEVDEHRASGIILDDFRAAKTGRITLENV
ncbi:MAG: ribosome biogenesis GTPase YlqF [Clostridiales bacterium]|jgi:ribosome biogenesis GTPase A|nr:ribosome biogenesis GTPase YlqF [Clostridiales bacterium]